MFGSSPMCNRKKKKELDVIREPMRIFNIIELETYNMVFTIKENIIALVMFCNHFIT